MKGKLVTLIYIYRNLILIMSFHMAKIKRKHKNTVNGSYDKESKNRFLAGNFTKSLFRMSKLQVHSLAWQIANFLDPLNCTSKQKETHQKKVSKNQGKITH